MATRFTPRIQAFYQRLLKAGTPQQLALTTAMRKLLTILNTLIKNDELWNVEPNKSEHLRIKLKTAADTLSLRQLFQNVKSCA